MNPMLTPGGDQELPPKLFYTIRCVPGGRSDRNRGFAMKYLAEWLLTEKTYPVNPKAPESSLVAAARCFYTSSRAESGSALPAGPVAPRKAFRFPTLGFPGLQSAATSPEGCCSLGSFAVKTPAASVVCHHRDRVLIDDQGRPVDGQGVPIQGSILHQRDAAGGNTPRIGAPMAQVIYICWLRHHGVDESSSNSRGANLRT